MYSYHTAPTDVAHHEYSDSISESLGDKLQEEKLLSQKAAQADSNVQLFDDTITTGWNISLILLFLQGVISVLWGSALVVFSSGVVAVAWTVSQYGQTHLAVINVIVTLIATISTTHLRYIIQEILQLYSSYVMVDGFSLNGLRWMQGIKEWSLFTVFGSRRTRVAWFAVYLAMAFHSASLVSILQPQTYYKNVYFNDPIACGVDPNSITLDPASNLPAGTQSTIDNQSFGIGLMLANYFEQVGGNTTTSTSGRVYRKDNLAYGAIGGLANGLQEIPGVSFTAECTNDLNTPNLTVLWSSVFPGRIPPIVSTLSDNSKKFLDNLPISPEMRIVTSDDSFNLTGGQMAMYALVNPSGSGGILAVDAADHLLGCVWQATPKLVFVQTVDFIARSLNSTKATVVPQLAGRAVLLTLQGIAEAVHLGANFYDGTDLIQPPVAYKTPPTSLVLQTLLADGGKASLTSFSMYTRSIFESGKILSGTTKCSSNNRTIAAHWRFGNSHNLGWVAIIGTLGVGVLAIAAVLWFWRRPRMLDIKALEVRDAFVLGKSYSSSDDGRSLDGNRLLRVKDGRVI